MKTAIYFSLLLSAISVLASAYASEKNIDLFTTAKAGNVSQLKQAISQGANLNAQNDDGYTPLIYAAYYGHHEAVQVLLDAKADPCLVDKKGNSALMGTLFKGYSNIAKSLITRCDVNHRNYQGQTALMYASLFGRDELARLLIESGAQTELKDDSGNDALSLAEGQWNQIMVKLLKTVRVIRH